MPDFPSAYRTSAPESVTARLILRMIVSRSSNIETLPPVVSDLLIFLSGSVSDIIFCPTVGIYGSGMRNTSP